MRILFVDDIKDPMVFGLNDFSEDDIARTPPDALEKWRSMKYDVVYLDHDMGLEFVDGSVLLNTMCSIKVPKMVANISNNPIGISRIRGVCKDFNIPFENHSPMWG